MKKNTTKWFSQCGQDKFVLEEIFFNKKHGNFVEVGAHDGISLSNTFAMELNFSWGGVCVEPSSRSSAILKRRKAQLFNVCACPQELEGQIVRFRENQRVELSHTIFEDLYESPYYAKELEMKENEYWDRLKKCKTLDSILTESKIGLKRFPNASNIVDYISIDTQGSEWMIMKDFPFDKWNVRVFTIANDMYAGGEKEKNRNKTKSLMENNGYSLLRMFTVHEIKRDNWGKTFKDEIIEDLYVKQDN